MLFLVSLHHLQELLQHTNRHTSDSTDTSDVSSSYVTRAPDVDGVCEEDGVGHERDERYEARDSPLKTKK